ncbi:MAG: hypothetical protein K9N23_08520 [Akkermansiaceae bacterium]|nr:hypothetical protein [Akkermansiaceae bacterium]
MLVLPSPAPVLPVVVLAVVLPSPALVVRVLAAAEDREPRPTVLCGGA